jgi:hypothetical protein
MKSYNQEIWKLYKLKITHTHNKLLNHHVFIYLIINWLKLEIYNMWTFNEKVIKAQLTYLMSNPVVSVSHLNQEIKCWRSFPLKNSFLTFSCPGFDVSQSNTFNSANLIKQLEGKFWMLKFIRLHNDSVPHTNHLFNIKYYSTQHVPQLNEWNKFSGYFRHSDEISSKP